MKLYIRDDNIDHASGNKQLKPVPEGLSGISWIQMFQHMP